MLLRGFVSAVREIEHAKTTRPHGYYCAIEIKATCFNSFSRQESDTESESYKERPNDEIASTTFLSQQRRLGGNQVGHKNRSMIFDIVLNDEYLKKSTSS